VTKFYDWLFKYGAKKLATDLTARGPDTKVTVRAVYGWAKGEHEPRGAKLRAIVDLSRGELTHEDVQQHFRTIVQLIADAPA
jgi:hypothetical protein